MALKTRVQPISDWVKVTVAESLSDQAKQRAVAEFARGRLAEAQAKNQAVLGKVPPHDTFVDGRKGAALESVNPHRGTIVFEFELFEDVLTWVRQALIERSPKRSGEYAAGHRLFADGVEVAAGAVPAAAEYSFTNLVPYARKIEIGKTKAGRDFVIQVPNRIYERTAKDARARFGNIAKIGFTYRGIVGGLQVNAEGLPSTLKRGPRGRFVKQGGSRAHNVAKVRFPTITIAPN